MNDYSEGAHPSVLEWLARTNLDQEDGYGLDTLTLQAADLLRQAAGNPAAEVHFVSGGTQANLIGLSSMLRSFESVIAVNTGHIYVHEAGSIEATGHKVNIVQSPDGKITGAQVRAVVAEHTDEHMVRPRAVYISNSTEVGTVYSKAELESVSQACRDLNLYLFLDGARIGSALTSTEADYTLPELSALVDMFYIGGTKNGALLGEAVVINNPVLQPDFRFHLKQKGALLAKGRLLGIQFLALFQDGLYLKLARHANLMAERLTLGIRALGFDFLSASTSNQIFPVFTYPVIHELEKDYSFYTWCPVDETCAAARLVTSWATPEAKVDEFLQDLKALARS